jgi:hypothetical protein
VFHYGTSLVPVELSEKELADLRAAAAERENLKKEVEASKAAAAKAAKEAETHGAELKKVAEQLQNPEVVKQLAERHGLIKGAPPPNTDDDPDAIVSRADLKRATEEAEIRADQRATHRVTQVLKNQRIAHEREAESKLEDYAEFKPAINEYLDKLDPALAASPTAHEEVYDYLYGKREKEKRLAARNAPPPDDDAPVSSTEETSRQAPPPTEGRPSPPIVGTQGSPRMSTRTPAGPKLTETEEYYRQRQGMSKEDWLAYREEIQPETDFMGMRDKDGRLRSRV